MNPNKHLQRSQQPRHRDTRALVLSLDERHGHDNGVAGKEWRELRRRLAEMMRANARGASHASAADVCGMLYSAGLDVPPEGVAMKVYA